MMIHKSANDMKEEENEKDDVLFGKTQTESEDVDTEEDLSFKAQTLPNKLSQTASGSYLDSYTTVDDKTRNFIHNKLKAYESRRRSAYKGKMESSSLYWRSFRDLLAASIHETGRAERLVLGTARANAVYAESMQASYQDVLVDDKGGLVLDVKKQRKLLEVRSTQDYDAAPFHESKSTRSRKLCPEEQRKSNMLCNLIESQANISERFGENSKELASEIASEMTQMRKNLEAKVTMISEVGDTIITELETTEKEVSRAWETYYAVAVKTLKREDEGPPQNPYSPGGISPYTRKPSEEPEESESIEECIDVWLVEMHYRVAVAYQSFLWEKASAELSKLFSSMKETECQRRMDVREFLVAFIQRQERLYLGLPNLQETVLKGLVSRDMDHTKLDEVVQGNIRKRAERLAKVEAKKKRELAIPKSLTGADPRQGNFTLQSPLQSELMENARVVEHKGAGMMASWKLSLAVVTADMYIHLFEMPLNTQGTISLGSAPEIAFQMLVPKVEVPSVNEPKNSSKKTPSFTSFVKGWCDHLTPSESMVLPNCSISQPKFGRETASFDIQEAIFNTGASKMFAKTTTKKCTLRTLNKKETQEWVTYLKSQK
mmetsp:Transcript_33715/g.38401  ORF Transcript_33715/g.38401 Transcript_33715/m.38401 type:complete len:604 (+) Transcript_33715:45-1856(+)